MALMDLDLTPGRAIRFPFPWTFAGPVVLHCAGDLSLSHCIHPCETFTQASEQQ